MTVLVLESARRCIFPFHAAAGRASPAARDRGTARRPRVAQRAAAAPRDEPAGHTGSCRPRCRPADPPRSLHAVAHRAADPAEGPAARFYRKKLEYWRRTRREKKDDGRYKEVNRELAFMEKQVRRAPGRVPAVLSRDRHDIEMQPRVQDVFPQLSPTSTTTRRPICPSRSSIASSRELFPTAITLNLSTIGEPLMSPYHGQDPRCVRGVSGVPQHHHERDRDERRRLHPEAGVRAAPH